MNCATPTDVTFSFTGFAARGGGTGYHGDGFGIAFFEDKACRMLIDNQPAATSPIADLIKNYPIKSRNVIAHIRKATQGIVPARELPSVPARAVGPALDLRPQRRPDRLSPVPVGRLSPGRRHRQRARVLRADAGTAQALPRIAAAAHRAVPHDRSAVARRRRTWCLQLPALERAGAVRALLDQPLLHHPPMAVLDGAPDRRRHERRFLRDEQAGDCVSVIATEPLTSNEEWTRFGEGELIMFEHGLPKLHATVPIPDDIRRRNAQRALEVRQAEEAARQAR
jgi:glutamine amidotransferase